MPSPQRPTLKDVAMRVGVSPATVSRALARPAMVNAHTLAEIEAVTRELGYTPLAAGRALASGRSRVVGAIVPTLDSLIFGRAVHAMQIELAAQGYQLLVASNDYNPTAETAVLRALLGQGIDGLILVGAQRTDESLSLLDRSGLPVVLTWCGDPRFDEVSIDNFRAGRLAAEHLLSLGHRNIGMLTGHLAVNDRQRKRTEGVRAALESAGLALPDWRVVDQPLTTAGGRSGCAALLSSADPPTGIVCGVDTQAIGCIAHARDRGVDVPRDLSIVGIDNLEMSANIAPPLTTVHIPTAKIGECAARMILRRIEGGTAQTAIELPIELVVRASTAPLASENSLSR